MNYPNNGAIAQRFTQHSKNFVGNKSGTPLSNSDYTQARAKAMSDIYDMAKSKGTTIDNIVTGILKNSAAHLKAYVVYKGEVPLHDPTALALQAALIRANDVATTANILDSDDETALTTIEGAENDEVAVNSPEADNVLDPVTAAALACVMQHISDTTGGGSMASALSSISSYARYVSQKSNSIDDIGSVSDPSTWSDISQIMEDGTVSNPSDTAAADNGMTWTSIGSTLAQIPATGAPVSVASGTPSISVSASSLPQAGPDTSAGGVLNSITSIFSGINQAATAVQQAANSTQGAVGAIKNAASGVGASSIQQYVQNNQSSIIIIIILILIVIYAFVHANRK